MKTLVIFHGPNCPDGFGAAYAAWKALGNKDVDYKPMNYGENLDLVSLAQYQTIYILDFSFKRDIMEQLIQDHKVICLDHHRTAKENLTNPSLYMANESQIVFDMDKSGAVLAYEHFFPGQEVPKLFQYLQDRDLWTWKLNKSHEVSAYISLQEKTFEAWQALELKLDNFEDWKTAVNMGAAVLTYQQQLTKSIADKAELTWIDGHHVYCVNSSVLQSEIGHELCERYPDSPFAAIYYTTATQVRYSLRSTGFDISEVARKYGGGGHKQAAGFELERIQPPVV